MPLRSMALIVTCKYVSGVIALMDVGGTEEDDLYMYGCHLV